MKNLQQLGAKIGGFLGKVPAKKIDLALAVIVTLLGLAIYSYVEFGGSQRAGFSFVKNIELRSLDARFRLRGPRPHDDRIVIVDIDEKTLQRVGAWPIPRNAYAKAVDQLSAAGAKVIAFDVTFPTPEKNSAVEALRRLESELAGKAPTVVIEKIRAIQQTSDNDVVLAEAMKRAGNVVLGHIFLDAERAKSQDERAADDYYFVLSDRPFPQMRKVTGGRDFDFVRAWEGRKPGEPTEPDAPSMNGRVMWGIESNIRILAEAARDYGFFNNDPDPDGTMRHATVVVRYQKDKGFFASLPFQTLVVYEDIKPQSIQGFVAENGLERVEVGPYRFDTQPNGSALINYTGPYNTYQHYSMADVINGSVSAGALKNKIVLVGATALGIGDLRTTPFESSVSYMGVEIHANALDNMLNSATPARSFLHRGLREEMIDLGMIVVLGLGLGFLFGRLKPMLAAGVAIVGVAAFGALVYVAFASFGMWLAFVIPAATTGANYAAITSFRMIFEEREKRKIRKSFSSYVSPGVISLIEKDPKKYFKPGGEMKDLTIMFSDIRNFTTISEGLTPDELVGLLNEYLTEMTDILFKRWGTLDKYIGDALMAFWGSPYPQEDHAVRACACALDMINRLDELNLKFEAQGRRQLPIGIGINSGPVNVGNMGSDKRLAWTVMGDAVNLASRLEGQTKDYKCRIITGESTYLQAKDHYVFRDLDKIRVKGKLKPVTVFELMGYAQDASHYADLLAHWSAAIKLYRLGNWPGAMEKFEALLTKYPDDGPAHTFLHRCHEKLADGAPLGEWDGVYVAKSK